MGMAGLHWQRNVSVRLRDVPFGGPLCGLCYFLLDAGRRLEVISLGLNPVRVLCAADRHATLCNASTYRRGLGCLKRRRPADSDGACDRAMRAHDDHRRPTATMRSIRLFKHRRLIRLGFARPDTASSTARFGKRDRWKDCDDQYRNTNNLDHYLSLCYAAAWSRPTGLSHLLNVLPRTAKLVLNSNMAYILRGLSQ
jgi:hypothetical protein